MAPQAPNTKQRLAEVYLACSGEALAVADQLIEAASDALSEACCQQEHAWMIDPEDRPG